MKINRFSRMICLLTLAALLAACDISSLPLGKSEPSATPPPTSTPIPPTNTATFTKTPQPTATKLPTQTPNAAATQRVTDMESLVKSLAEKGYLGSSDGKFYALKDFSNEWAQINWYQWDLTDQSPADFVLQADLSWESGTKTPDPSGCGIVFHVQDNGDHYLAWLSTDGWFYLGSNINNQVKFLGGDGKRYGPEQYKGQANLVLVVKGAQFRVLVDGKSIGVFSGYSTTLLDGGLGYTIVSGTNAGFGTRCNMTNINLWQMTP